MGGKYYTGVKHELVINLNKVHVIQVVGGEWSGVLCLANYDGIEKSHV